MFAKRVHFLVFMAAIAAGTGSASTAAAQGIGVVSIPTAGLKIVTNSGFNLSTVSDGLFFPLNEPVFTRESVNRAAAFAAYKARLASRRSLARQLRRQRNQQRIQQNRVSGYTFPNPARYSYLTTDSLGYVTGVDLRSRL